MTFKLFWITEKYELLTILSILSAYVCKTGGYPTMMICICTHSTTNRNISANKNYRPEKSVSNFYIALS